MFERYTEDSRRAIFYALHHALHRGAAQITAGDLVIGIATDTLKPSHPLCALKSHRVQLCELLFPNASKIEQPAKREIPLDQSSKIALAQAVQEARRDNRYGIGSEHLLRGVLLTKDPTKSALATTGYTLSAVRRTSRQSYAGNPDRPAPLDEARQRKQDKWLIIILWILLAYMILGACQ